MMRFSLLLLTAVAVGSLTAAAQNAAPTVKAPIADMTLYAGAPNASIDLTSAFEDPDLTPAVRLQTDFGAIDIALFQRQKPITVANFLRYVDENRYFTTDPTTKQLASSFIHRSAPGFVLQGGGFIGTVNPSGGDYLQATPVATLPKIQNEPGISNRRGTLAMAKLGSDPNSATSQWFINLANNAHSVDPQTGVDNGLDVQNGGFAVFARVLGDGMDVADHIANLPIYNASSYNSAFTSIPLHDLGSQNYVAVRNLVSLPSIARINSVHSPLTFTATSDNNAIATATVSDSNLLVSGKAVGGIAHITVTATDVDGASVSRTFAVNFVAAPGRLVNISTRMQVGTADQALFGGFIVRGDSPKRVLIRAIGPSLSSQGINGPLADPTLELYDASGALLASSDSWADANKQEISDTGIAPSSTKEAAILTTLSSDNSGVGYTAIVRGLNNTTGVGVVEVYDLDAGAGSTLVNISSRGRVGTVDNDAMIGGFFVGGTDSKRVLIRGLGPSLTSQGISGVLSDPKLQVVDSNGTEVDSNDDWQTSAQASEIQASGLAPTNPKESASLKSLAPGAYTAIVRSNNNSAGIGVVEVYQL